MILLLKQKLISLAMAGLITLGCTGIAGIAAFIDATTNSTVAYADEWRYSNGGWWLQTSNGYATGWKQIGESIWSPWYYFDYNGWMKTGWQWIGGKWYYFDNSGVMQTNWQSIGGKWYYFNHDGAMQTGWQAPLGSSYVDRNWYYFNSSGTMVTGWNKIGSNWYYFNSSGAMQIGWQKIGGKWYHFNGSGAMNTNKWISNYYVKNDGSMATNQWIGKYYVGTNGLWGGAKTNLNPLHIETDFFELDLPESWKDMVSCSVSNNHLRVYLSSLKNYGQYSLIDIIVSPVDYGFYYDSWGISKPIGKTPSGATVYIQYSDSVGFLATIEEIRDDLQSYPTLKDYYSAAINLLTNGKITLDDIMDNPDIYITNTAVHDFIDQEIIPAIKLRN